MALRCAPSDGPKSYQLRDAPQSLWGERHGARESMISSNRQIVLCRRECLRIRQISRPKRGGGLRTTVEWIQEEAPTQADMALEVTTRFFGWHVAIRSVEQRCQGINAGLKPGTFGGKRIHMIMSQCETGEQYKRTVAESAIRSVSDVRRDQTSHRSGRAASRNPMVRSGPVL